MNFNQTLQELQEVGLVPHPHRDNHNFPAFWKKQHKQTFSGGGQPVGFYECRKVFEENGLLGLFIFSLSMMGFQKTESLLTETLQTAHFYGGSDTDKGTCESTAEFNTRLAGMIRTECFQRAFAMLFIHHLTDHLRSSLFGEAATGAEAIQTFILLGGMAYQVNLDIDGRQRREQRDLRKWPYKKAS